MADLAGVMGCDLDAHGFVKQPEPILRALHSTKDGIYVCGCAAGPADIPDSIAQASAAALLAARHTTRKLADKATHKIDRQPERLAYGDATPRVGVFVCQCGLNIAGVVDTDAVAMHAGKQRDVVHSETMVFACSETAQRRIQEIIREQKLNRVVVAACTPRTHEPVFRRACAEAGLNQYLVEMANIRDQCSWVHAREPVEATKKASDLVRAAVARAKRLAPLPQAWVDVSPRALVIGGGISGMHAAAELAGRGIETYLVESGSELGGLVGKLSAVWPGEHLASSNRVGTRIDETSFGGTTPQTGAGIVRELKERLVVTGVEVLLDSTVEDVKGSVGNFTVKVTKKTGGRPIEIDGIGGIVVAIGAVPHVPEGEFGYRRFANVITSLELEHSLATGKHDHGDGRRASSGEKRGAFAFIQCVGSRDERPPAPGGPASAGRGCSRYCCDVTLKQALELRKLGKEIVVFYRDIRTYAHGAEALYRKAREAGVRFLRYDPDRLPVVVGAGTGPTGERDGQQPNMLPRAASVVLDVPVLGRRVELPVETVVLAVGLRPRAADVARIGEILKIPRSSDGFFMERHPKLGPVETVIEGVFACGTALGPKNICESLNQAGAAAAKLAALISAGRFEMEAITAVVDESVCRGCGVCVETCKFGAPGLYEVPELGFDAGLPVVRGDAKRRVSKINAALCKGCGTCVAKCPNGALSAQHFADDQIDAVLEALMARGGL
ncbi:MAG: FAD-dependent oxidoreductase, partial [Planctomycetota bacterium]|nr:FAD-dependent oxidoreductase [Planctomycetota bacterium]